MKKIFTTALCLVLGFITLLANDKGNPRETHIPSTVATTQVTINPQTTYQTIAGFGGANRMWGTQSLKPAEAIKAFGVNDGELVLSLFRVRLSSNRNDWSIITEAIKEANKKGVKVLACPWSPPAALKSNNSDIRGTLLSQNYTAFKTYINEFIAYQTQNGAKIDVVSIQNEPDYTPTYESCDWTAQNFIDFLNAPGEIVGAKVAAPESLNFNQTLTNAILSNSLAAAKIDIVAGHIYGGGLAKFPLAEQQNKEIWMTEYLTNLNTGNTGAAAWSTYSENAIWVESLKMLGTIHNAMSNNWNAYIWWYLQRYYSFIGDGEQNTTNGTVLKRGYAFSHFSKYVRPGFVRIGVTVPATSSLQITAYKKATQTVVVIVNQASTAVSGLQLSGLIPQVVTSYTTTETATLTQSTLTPTNNVIGLDITPYSVTTLVIEENGNLPIELTKFDVKRSQTAALLTWTTASEKNNAAFNIEQSTNGTDFQTVGQVKGHGTTTAKTDYNFEHSTPSVGINYYRLKQVDFDGTATYSAVRSLAFGKNGLVVKTTLVHDALDVVVNDETATPLSIFNAAGQQVLSLKAQGAQRLDVSSLPVGLYLIRTATGDVGRFVKQ